MTYLVIVLGAVMRITANLFYPRGQQESTECPIKMLHSPAER